MIHAPGTHCRREEDYGSSRVLHGRMGHDPSHSRARVSLSQNHPMYRGSQERRSRDTEVAEEMYPSESENESAVEVDKQKQTKKT